MAVLLPPIDSIASALSLILATIASLRAASRLESRICNNGSIGLMDGPPILGPRVMEIEPSSSKQQHDDNRIDGGEKNNKAGDDTADQQNIIIEASPLWEHTEAFRRAVILGLVFDEDNYEYVSNSIFSDVITIEGKPINVRGGSEDDDLVIAAAVEAGLLLPSSTRGGGKGTNNVGSSHRVRGGGVGLSAKSHINRKRTNLMKTARPVAANHSLH